MKRGSTIFLRATVSLIGAAVLALCVFALPAGLADDRTGVYKPILLGLYIPAIPFFYALYQTLRLLHYIDEDKAFSDLSITALRYIKYCALIIAGLFAVGLPYIYFVADKDDAPGVLAIALVITFASVVIAVFASVMQKVLQNAIELKSENDLTV